MIIMRCVFLIVRIIVFSISLFETKSSARQMISFWRNLSTCTRDVFFRLETSVQSTSNVGFFILLCHNYYVRKNCNSGKNLRENYPRCGHFDNSTLKSRIHAIPMNRNTHLFEYWFIHIFRWLLTVISLILVPIFTENCKFSKYHTALVDLCVLADFNTFFVWPVNLLRKNELLQ